MSLRYKILITIVTVMILILGILTFNLWVSTWTRIEKERFRIAEAHRRIIQDWLNASAPHQDWQTLKEKLSASALFDSWVIVTDKLEVLDSSSPLENRAFYQEDKTLGQVIRERQSIIEGNEVSAPLLLPDGRVFGIKMKLQHLAWSEFNPAESIRIILWIMPLGTILLIISIYILLTRLVIRPIEMLAATSQRIAQGDYSATIPPAKGNDEIAHLINTFRTMLEELKDYQGNLQTKIEEARAKIKATEEQLIIAQRLSATGTLAAGIAHEINNPLSGILNAAQALKKGELPPARTTEYLHLIVDGLTRIQDTLKQILQFFPRKLTPQPTDLKPLIDRAVLLVQHRLQTNHIAVINNLPANLPRVFGDENELQQVFLNLIINALDAILAYREKYKDPTRGSIQISYEPAGKDDDSSITIALKDDGIGMTQEEVSRAFDLFYTTKEPGKGTGLGLSVVYNIVENHKGQIRLASKKGEGTTVRVTLPIVRETIKSMLKGTYLTEAKELLTK